MSNTYNTLLGCRVVRGPNFKWVSRAKEEGRVGIISRFLNRTVILWEDGIVSEFDLENELEKNVIIIDNAQIGVSHPFHMCDSCLEHGISGMLFKCTQCPDYSLCSFCYGENKHDLEHSFLRYTTADPTSVLLPPRISSIRIQLRGVYTGAIVIRGPHWNYEDQNFGGFGRVIKIGSSSNNQNLRDMVEVHWENGIINAYRRGLDGKVDIWFVAPDKGGYYYEGHMPVLANYNQNINPVSSSFKIADQVRICAEEDMLRKLQVGHGGWKPSLTPVLSQLGNVIGILDNGDIRVEFDTHCWTFNPAALLKVLTFCKGDYVKVLRPEAFKDQVCKIIDILYFGGLYLEMFSGNVNFNSKWVTSLDDRTTHPQSDNAVADLQSDFNALSIQKSSKECIVCNEELELIKFVPCQHQIACEDCSKRMKKCIRCGLCIEQRLATRLVVANSTKSSDTRVEDDTNTCVICMERSRNVAFLCGHSTCSECAAQLEVCHICRGVIQHKIHLY